MAYTADEIAQLKARLSLYLAAEEAILRNQSYRIGDRELTRADLRWVAQQIKDLRTEVRSNDPAGVRARGRARRGVVM